jgi:bifunctional DNA-binding transcriptional regulator/antitoxin component of YhaV-PrlF toxin-antitoxin module
MSQVQTYLLKFNPKNGTIVIPKKAREQFGEVSNLLLIVANGKLELVSPKYTFDEVVKELPPLKTNKKLTDEDFSKAVGEEVVENYKKSL